MPVRSGRAEGPIRNAPIQGRPITITAGCTLHVTGEILSVGGDPGSDRITITGCDVTISGETRSSSAGHEDNNALCEQPGAAGDAKPNTNANTASPLSERYSVAEASATSV